MQAEAAHLGVAEEDGAAAVGLQSVFVRVDDDRVAPGDRPPGLRGEPFRALRAGEQAADYGRLTRSLGEIEKALRDT
ncbi:hypothetical protein [Streptomyces massasporeus]|uniref:hypothetical protein n=1 Tax=Streptomyces massasporeus TaxID=67324 RepID=UPI0034055BB0